MGLAQSPKVVTDGLVFYYDQNNIKSYQGPAIQNLAATLAFNNSINTGISMVGGYETANVPQLGQVNAVFTTIQNNYTSFSPNSADCCPSPLYYGSGFTVSPSTLYTYAIVYKVISGYTNQNYMYRYEYTSNSGSYVTEGGVHNDSNRIHLGDGWYWAWGTFTTQATTNWISYHAAFYYRYSNLTDKLSIARVLIAQGNYTALHPIYWPTVNTTRSSTQVLTDLSRNNTVTATNLAYASNGTFSFNGSDSLTVPFNSSLFTFNNEQTIIIWMKNEASLATRRNPYNQAFGGAGTITHENNTNFNYFYGTSGINNSPYTSHTSPFSVVFNETAQIAITRNVSQTAWYKNGALGNTRANPYGSTVVTGTSPIVIGTGYTTGFIGSLYIVQVYNRTLTAAEIQQNFNALRGRYGI